MLIVDTIHDAIDGVTTTVEDIHQAIAALPLDVLAGIEPIRGIVDDVRAVQSDSIAVVYGLVRTVNDQVRQLTTGSASR